MKKIVSLMLVLIMVFAMSLPLSVTAEETDVFRLERTSQSYSTFKAAAEAAEDGDTLTMLKDYNISGEANKYYLTKAITVNGGGHTLTNNGAGAYLWFFAVPDGKEVTLKNVTIESKGGFRVCATGQTVIMDHVTATITYDLFMNLQITGGYGSADKLTTVTFKNSTINHNGVTPAIATYSASNFIVNVQENSTVKKGLDSAFNTVNANDLAYSTIAFTQGNNITLNVDGTSVIAAARGDDAKIKSKTITCFCTDVSKTVKVTVNLEKGAQLRLEDIYSNQCKFYTAFRSGAAPVVVDKGAVWTISKEVAKTGVELPADLKFSTGETLLGWSIEGKLVNGGTYRNENATDAIAFSSLKFSNTSFGLVDGASIRTAGPYGIRFTARVSAEFYEDLKKIDPNVEFGIVVAPSTKVFDNFNVGEMLEKDYKKVAVEQWSKENENGYHIFNLACYGMPESYVGFSTRICAIAYFTIHQEDGSVITIYSTYDAAQNARSLYDVAQKAFENGVTDNELINRIIELGRSQ